jgi:hypothetical protein
MGHPRKRRAARRSPARKCAPCIALEAHPIAGPAVKRGRQSVKTADRGHIDGNADCGLEFDAAFAPAYNHQHRFDYLFVRKPDCAAVAVEVHPASSTGNVAELINKRRGTIAILEKERLAIRVKVWHWAVPGSGTICFTSADKYGLSLIPHGIRQPRRRVSVDD